MGRRADAQALNGTNESNAGLASDPAVAAAQDPIEVEGGTESQPRQRSYENGHAALSVQPTGDTPAEAGATPTNGRSRRRQKSAVEVELPEQEEPSELSQVRISEAEGGVGMHGQTLRRNLSPLDAGSSLPMSPVEVGSSSTAPIARLTRSKKEDHDDVSKFGQDFKQRQKDQREKEGTRLQRFKAESTVLSETLKDHLEATVKKAGISNVRSLRFMSRARQIEQPLWKFLVSCPPIHTAGCPANFVRI